MINIDIDILLNKKLDSDIIIKKILEIWKSDPINNFKTLLKNLDNDYIIFDNPTQKLLNNTFTSSFKDNKIQTIIEFKDDIDIQNLPTGKIITKEEIENEAEKKEAEIEEKKEDKEDKERCV